MKIIINLGREILLLGSVRESIMKPSETSSGNSSLFNEFVRKLGLFWHEWAFKTRVKRAF
jgi:hypothetical protein